MPPVYKQFDSNYSIETHTGKILHYSGDIYEKEMSELLNRKWKEERAVLKAVLSVMNDLSSHSKYSMLIDRGRTTILDLQENDKDLSRQADSDLRICGSSVPVRI